MVRARKALRNVKVEVEKGFDPLLGFKEAQRCLNCDVQTVFSAPACIECDACVDICPMDCITFTRMAKKPICATRLNAPATKRSRRISTFQDGSRPAA
jgi:formate dehydrogenase beta subunit